MSSIISLKVLFSNTAILRVRASTYKIWKIIQSMTLAQHFMQIYHFKPTEVYYTLGSV